MEKAANDDFSETTDEKRLGDKQKIKCVIRGEE